MLPSIPAIDDPNTEIKLWESGAIIEYLIETYDKENKLSFRSAPEKYLTSQWLFFQVSGQGPYFGQGAWYSSPYQSPRPNIVNTYSQICDYRFANYHPERIESATERYKKEIIRVNGVLNHALQGKHYLVGNKCTHADLAFITWDSLVESIFKDDTRAGQMKKDYPDYSAWMERLTSRPAVKKAMDDRAKLIAH